MANTKVDIKYFSKLNVDSFGGGFAAGFVRNLHTPLDMGSVQPFLSYFTNDLNGNGTTNNLYKGQLVAVTSDDYTGTGGNTQLKSTYAPHNDITHNTGLWYVYGYSHTGADSDPGTYYADRILTRRETEQLFENRAGSYYSGVGEWWQLTRSTYTDDRTLRQKYIDGTMTDADKNLLKYAEIFNDYAHNVAYAKYSSASGEWTRSGNTNEFSIGQYNVTSTAYSGSIFNVGIGTADGSRKNAFTVFKNGASVLNGTTYITDRLVVAKQTILQSQTDIYGPTYAHNNIFLDSGVSGGGQPWDTGSERYIKFTGQSDAAYIRFYCVGDGSDNSADVNELEISTFDNNEPIRVRQYGVKGDNPTYPLNYELTLLDRWGNTYIPNNTYIGKNLSVGQAEINTSYTFYVNGTANITGRTTLNDTLTTAGDTVLQSKLAVGQTGISTYTFHVQGTANVSGATTLNSTLTVKDNSVLQDKLTIGQTVANTSYTLHVNGTANVTGQTTLNDTLTVAKNSIHQTRITVGQDTANTTYTLHVQGTANVSGATTLNSTLTVKDSSVHQTRLTVGQTSANTSYTLYVNGTANITGATTLNNTLAVAGATTLYSTLTTAGQVIMQDKLTVGTSIASSYTLHVEGTHNVTGKTTLNDTLTVAKESILQSRLTVGQGATNTTYTLHVNGTSNLVGNTTITGTVTASGDTTLQSKLTVGATTANTSYTLHVAGTHNATGQTTLNDTLTVAKASILQDRLTVGQGTVNNTYTVHINGTTNIVGNTTITGTVTASGNAVMQSRLTVGATTANTSYTLHVAGDARLTSRLYVDGASILAGNTVHYGNISLTGTDTTNEDPTRQRTIEFICANNDWARIRTGGNAKDDGWIEIATGDNGSEPIYARQYDKDSDGNYYIKNEVMLLDKDGNTYFPNNVYANATFNAPNINIGKDLCIEGNLTVKGDSYSYHSSYNNATYVSGYFGTGSNCPTYLNGRTYVNAPSYFNEYAYFNNHTYFIKSSYYYGYTYAYNVSYHYKEVYAPLTYSYVGTLGPTAYLGVILAALLEAPKYTRPVLGVKFARHNASNYYLTSQTTTITYGDTIDSSGFKIGFRAAYVVPNYNDVDGSVNLGNRLGYSTAVTYIRFSYNNGTNPTGRDATTTGWLIPPKQDSISNGTTNNKGGTPTPSVDGLTYTAKLAKAADDPGKFTAFRGSVSGDANILGTTYVYGDSADVALGASFKPGGEGTFTLCTVTSYDYTAASQMYFQQLADNSTYIAADGSGSTAKFDAVASTNTNSQTWKINVVHRYYYGTLAGKDISSLINGGITSGSSGAFSANNFNSGQGHGDTFSSDVNISWPISGSPNTIWVAVPSDGIFSGTANVESFAHMPAEAAIPTDEQTNGNPTIRTTCNANNIRCAARILKNGQRYMTTVTSAGTQNIDTGESASDSMPIRKVRTTNTVGNTGMYYDIYYVNGSQPISGTATIKIRRIW